MARVTLRLPDSLHARLVAEPRDAIRSLNELIVESTASAVAAAEPVSVDEKKRGRHARGAGRPAGRMWTT